MILKYQLVIAEAVSGFWAHGMIGKSRYWRLIKSSGGMVGMMNMQQVTSPSDKTKKQMDAAATAHLQNGECVIPETEERKAPQLYIGLPMERGVSVQLYRDEQLGVNEAEILIPVEQVARLTRALIEHPLLLPTSYAQSSRVDDGQHILQIASKEALVDFVERLTDALDVLARTK